MMTHTNFHSVNYKFEKYQKVDVEFVRLKITSSGWKAMARMSCIINNVH